MDDYIIVLIVLLVGCGIVTIAAIAFCQYRSRHRRSPGFIVADQLAVPTTTTVVAGSSHGSEAPSQGTPPPSYDMAKLQ